MLNRIILFILLGTPNIVLSKKKQKKSNTIKHSFENDIEANKKSNIFHNRTRSIDYVHDEHITEVPIGSNLVWSNATYGHVYDIQWDRPEHEIDTMIERRNNIVAQERQRRLKQRIVGGDVVHNTEYPSFAFNGCGGTVIRGDLILTAAHCQSIFQERGIIYIGPDQYKNGKTITGGQAVRIKSIIVHPSWSWDTQQNDVLILKLVCKTTAPLQRLNWNRNVPAIDAPVTVIGFGSQYEGGPYNTNLNAAVVNTVDGPTCLYQYGGGWIVDTTMICAAIPNGGKDACG